MRNECVVKNAIEVEDYKNEKISKTTYSFIYIICISS